MILQPLVENAYSHGLSRIQRDGLLIITARNEASRLRLQVSNSGVGLLPEEDGHKGVGLANVQDRLKLHYGDEQTFSIEELLDRTVQVIITLPLSFREAEVPTLTGYGVA